MNPFILKIGLISFFSDLSSEFLYPITPVFLTSILGASMASVGMIDGVAEFVSSVLKYRAGAFSDKLQKRKPFVIAGYALATVAKGMIGFATGISGVFAGRVLDRAGKGIRTSPRDALIVDMIPKENLGYAFGVHRAWDTAGAVLGPLAAYFLLKHWTHSLSILYFYSMIPGAVAVFISFSMSEKKVLAGSVPKTKLPKASLRALPKRFFIYIVAWCLFSLGNSSDAFLILKATHASFSLEQAILLYCFFNFTYAASSPYLGKLSDRYGKKIVLLLSLVLFSCIYLGFGFSKDPAHFWALFGLYGLFMGMSEGVGKAMVGELVHSDLTATAQGFFGMATGICSLIASLSAGLLWDHLGSTIPFLYGGAMATLGAVVFFLCVYKVRDE